MKTMIKISVLLNVILLGAAVFLGIHRRTVPVSAPAMPAVAAAVEPKAVPAPAVQTVVAPFHWSQLMSTNGYRSFVASLRAADCPEPTVEDIVRGNVQRAFDWERNKSHVDASEPGPWSAQAQQQMVAYLLGRTPNAPAVADAAEGSAAVAAPEKPVDPMLIPLQDIDPAALAALNLSDDQKQTIVRVQQAYSAALNGQKQLAANTSQPSQSSSEQASGTAQNPQSPGSATSPNAPQSQTGLTAAEQAELDADAELQAGLGSDGYLAYKQALEQTVLENQLKSHPSWVSVEPQW